MSSTDLISAWKPCPPAHLTPCALDHPEAVRFDVKYPGSTHGHKLEFTSLYHAQWAAMAVVSSFEAGKVQAMADLRRFIGIK